MKLIEKRSATTIRQEFPLNESAWEPIGGLSAIHSTSLCSHSSRLLNHPAIVLIQAGMNEAEKVWPQPATLGESEKWKARLKPVERRWQNVVITTDKFCSNYDFTSLDSTTVVVDKLLPSQIGRSTEDPKEKTLQQRQSVIAGIKTFLSPFRSAFVSDNEAGRMNEGMQSWD